MSSNFVRLGQVATFINGKAFKPDEWTQSGTPIIRIQNLTDNNKYFNYYSGKLEPRYIVKKGDILISWSASLGVFEWSGEDAALNQHIFKVQFNKLDVDKTYFKFIVSQVINEMLKYVHGSTMKHIVKGDFDNTKIPLPPLPDQQRIATILDHADAVYRKNREVLEKYNQLAQSVFLEMFGNPNINQHSFPIGTIRDIVEDINYGTSAKSSDNGKYQYLRMNNITYNGEIDLTDLKYIDLPLDQVHKYIVRNRDLLFNRTNSKELVGKTAVFKENKEMVIAGYLIRIRTNSKANPDYISGYLNSNHGKLSLRSMCKSIIGMANINAQELQDIKILIPPIELQNSYSSIIDEIMSQKDHVKLSLNKSEELFQCLLQQAFRGEL